MIFIGLQKLDNIIIHEMYVINGKCKKISKNVGSK